MSSVFPTILLLHSEGVSAFITKSGSAARPVPFPLVIDYDMIPQHNFHFITHTTSDQVHGFQRLPGTAKHIHLGKEVSQLLLGIPTHVLRI